MEEKRIKFYQFLIGTGDYTKDFGSFETQFFKDEVSVKKIWSFVLQKLYYTKSFKNFMSQYACDMTCQFIYLSYIKYMTLIYFPTKLMLFSYRMGV